MRNHVFASALITAALPATATPIVHSPVTVQLSQTVTAASSDLAVGGYATLRGAKCCTIFRIVDAVVTDSPNPQKVWIVQFHSDSSGNWPIVNQYWGSAELRFNGPDLVAVQP